uniref:Reverse transcriptase N-terminal domain-containing protein n=1 Tax=Bostrychia simpliciuscula TaxID=324754 RepID=A0A1Z1M844_9FLOR|nr:hypothetical protein [Bostrychia simpliciuscula]ARW62063.1 hypothetical protein [Bostrychia simpliciuscula]
MIQKQIYNATKKYDLHYVHKLQNYLLNSNEGKVISIDKVLKDVCNYYYFYDKEVYLIETYKKFTILKFLFNINFFKTKINSIIIENIKQYLIYLCIEPEWKAKFSKVSNTNSNFCKFHELKKYKSFKYIFTYTLISKLNLIKYIKQSIIKWLYNNFCTNLDNLYNIKIIKYKQKEIKTNNYTILSSLSNLLLNVVNLDSVWYSFYIKNINCILKYTSLSYNTYSSNKIISLNYNLSLIYSIKLFLYNKNNFNKFKINTFINKNYLFTKSKNMIQNFYNNNLEYITFNLINYTNKAFNTTMYYWLKKTTKFNFYSFKPKNVQMNNSSLNNYLYNYNINSYYKNLFLYINIIFNKC